MKRRAVRSLLIHVTGHVSRKDLEAAVRMLQGRLGEVSVVRAVIRELKTTGPAKQARKGGHE